VADRPSFESPIRRTLAAGSALRDQSATVKTLIRALPGSPAAAQLGVGFGSSGRVGQVLVCGSRPGEWLLLGEPAEVLDGLDTSGHVSVIDLTHGRALLRLVAADSARVLEKMCSLDLSDDMTPNGAVTSASLAAISCDLVRDDVDGTPSYLIACDRSFGDYLVGAVLDAGDEFGIA
jgi:heterotetrameric sarcosine oxidase gamma subunit